MNVDHKYVRAQHGKSNGRRAVMGFAYDVVAFGLEGPLRRQPEALMVIDDHYGRPGYTHGDAPTPHAVYG